MFIHIPKTGGTSIESCLDLKQSHRNHAFYIENLKNYEKYFIFASIRNPFDRAVSDYKWVTNSNHIFPAKKLKEMFVNRSFKYFLHHYYSLSYEEVKHFRSKEWFNLHHLTHCKSQLEMLNPIKKINFLIRFETLQQDFDRVCKKIKIPPKTLPHLNKVAGRHYTEYYDEEAKQFIEQKYAQDIKYFKYEFGK